MPLIAEATETAIANEALGHLGAKPILSIDSGTDFKSRTCRQYFPVARDALLRQYPWNFAEFQATLNASALAPKFGFCRSFPLPADPYCLAVRELPDACKDDKWKVVGRALYCDLAAPLKMVGTARVVDVTLYDALFRVALGYTLASLMAVPIAKDRDLKKDMADLATQACETAFPTDASEGNADNEPPEQDIITARF